MLIVDAQVSRLSLWPNGTCGLDAATVFGGPRGPMSPKLCSPFLEGGNRVVVGNLVATDSAANEDC